MTRRSWSGFPSCFLVLAGLTTALAEPRGAAASQDPAPTSFVGAIAPSFAVDPATDLERGEQQEGDKKKASVKKRGDKLKFHWRSGSLDYGKKARIDFRSKMRAEVRGSDAAITKEAL